MWDHRLEKARMNITLPLRFLKPVKISVPKLCKTETQTEKVKIEVVEDRQYVFINTGAVVVSTIDLKNDMILMVWHMIDDGVCEVDFGVKINKNMTDSKIN